jgi:hypothetical protein
VAVGLQSRYAAGYGNLIYDAGLLTDELGATAQALPNVRDAELGRVENLSGVASDLWFSHYRTIKTANDLINNAPNVQLDPAMLSGIMALAYTLKAGAISDLVQGYQQIADPDAGSPTPPFISRSDALAGRSRRSTAPTRSSTPPRRDGVRDARAGDELRPAQHAPRVPRAAAAHQRARAAAGHARGRRRRGPSGALGAAVHRPGAEPALRAHVGLVGGAAARRLPPRGGPGPATYHVTAAAVTGFFQPLDNYARYNVATGALPLYFPDEMLLIKAEALVGLGQLAAAQAALDSVRTDCGAPVAGDPNACLAPLPAGRAPRPSPLRSTRTGRFELFATGQRWEDARRQGLVGATSVAKRCWLPYPIAERNANPAKRPCRPEAIDPRPHRRTASEAR